MFDLLNKDLNNYCKNGRISEKLRTILLEHSFHLVILIRLGGLLRKIPFFGRIFGVMIEYIIRVLYASDINCKSQIGGGLFIVHGHDIVIGAKVVVGNNCKIFNGVTLGGQNTEIDNAPQPIIGDNVVISTGAKILGDIKIGNDCIVGANSVVVKSVDENSIIAGVPARFIKYRYNK